ncbi:lipopolysaccharide kinase InaA family protein, partial [Bacillus cereus]
QRIYGHDGQLLYRKQQTGHVYRSLSRPLGYPTVMREQDALMHCRRLGVPVPALVFAGCRKREGVWQAVLLTEG